MEDRLQLSGAAIAALVGGAVAVALVVLVATWGGGGDASAKPSKAEQIEIERFIDDLIIGLALQPEPAAAPASLLGELFGKLLPDYAVRAGKVSRAMSLDQARRRVEHERRSIMSDRLKHVLDPLTMRVLGSLLDRALAVRLNRGGSDHVDALESATIAFNNRVVGAGHRFAVHSYVNAYGAIWLLGYALDQVVEYRAGPHVVRAIRARRIDTLNFHARALGFASPERELAWVRIRRIEEDLVRRVLPQLGAQPPVFYEMDTRYDRSQPWYRTANERARKLIRRDYGEVAANGAVRRLGELLAARHEVLSRWYDLRDGFRRTARRMTRSYHIPRDFAAALRGFPRDDLLELMVIESELATTAMRGAFAAVMELAMRTVEHHEVQHRLDYLNPAFPHPEALAALVGPAEDEEGKPRRFARSTNLELSAMVAELARAGSRVASELASQVAFLLDPSQWSSPYGKAAVIILDGLAAQLGVVAKHPFRDGQSIDRARVTELFLALSDKPPKALSRAANALWQQLYAATLPPLQRSVR